MYQRPAANILRGGAQVAKRALIVDDSKSARLSLARTLEKHAIEVDTAESAEQALEYLSTHRPDAIFMDHNMPGMDGLQAVQAIKNNPRTATIPIMMYTSQEGELYLSQARALGAIGVLPKQIKSTDITKVLYQLNLAADRRSSSDSGSFRSIPDTVAVIGSGNEGIGHAAETSFNSGALREQLTDLRRTVLSGFDSQGDRLLADVRSVLQDLQPHPPMPAAVTPGRPWQPWLPAVALAAFVILVGLLWHQSSELSAVEDQLAALKASLPATLLSAAETSAASSAPPPATADAAPASDSAPAPRITLRPIIQPVPYGAEAFSGTRLDGLRQLFDRLSAQGFQGTVDIRSYGGRFCLVGNASDGYSLAPDDLLYARCDLVSGGRDDPNAGAVRIPVAMADLVGSLRTGTHDQARVQITGGDGSSAAAYPAVTDTLTAGEWNRAAAANNRLEIRLR
jgi:CheY-like chemotaxis protein